MIDILNSNWFEELANIIIAFILFGFAILFANVIVKIEFEVIRPLFKRLKIIFKNR